MPQIALLGSISSHGGRIITGSSNLTCDGIPVALFGSLHICPIPKHGVTRIINSSSLTNNNGTPIARVGDNVGCGAIIISGAKVTSE